MLSESPKVQQVSVLIVVLHESFSRARALIRDVRRLRDARSDPESHGGGVLFSIMYLKQSINNG